MKVKCPRCGKETEYKVDNLYRPFCSERCKMIDLGKWANEDYKVPTEDGGNLENEEIENDEDSKN